MFSKEFPTGQLKPPFPVPEVEVSGVTARLFGLEMLVGAPGKAAQPFDTFQVREGYYRPQIKYVAYEGGILHGKALGLTATIGLTCNKRVPNHLPMSPGDGDLRQLSHPNGKKDNTINVASQAYGSRKEQELVFFRKLSVAGLPFFCGIRNAVHGRQHWHEVVVTNASNTPAYSKPSTIGFGEGSWRQERVAAPLLKDVDPVVAAGAFLKAYLAAFAFANTIDTTKHLGMPPGRTYRYPQPKYHELVVSCSEPWGQRLGYWTDDEAVDMVQPAQSVRPTLTRQKVNEPNTVVYVDFQKRRRK